MPCSGWLVIKGLQFICYFEIFLEIENGPLYIGDRPSETPSIALDCVLSFLHTKEFTSNSPSLRRRL
jgi:hypothetical protein